AHLGDVAVEDRGRPADHANRGGPGLEDRAEARGASPRAPRAAKPRAPLRSLEHVPRLLLVLPRVGVGEGILLLGDVRPLRRELGVERDVLLPALGRALLREDRLRRARRLARPAVDA